MSKIFVRHFNSLNTDFKLEDYHSFAHELINKLKETLGNNNLVDLKGRDIMNCIELVKAFKILMKQERLDFSDQIKTFDDYMSTFCNMIKVDTNKPKIENPAEPE